LEIIYIIGAGRSGTTLLDILLGNQPEVFSAGELNRFLKRNGVPHSARDKEVADFWSDVRNSVGLLSEQLKKTAEKLEYHSGFFFKYVVGRKQMKAYETFNQQLFAAIDERSGSCSVIVDSSKYPMRAKHLSKIFKDKISFVYLQRNPSDVVNSFGKKDVEQPAKSAISAHVYLFVVNVLARYVLYGLKKSHRCSTISYDQLVSEPEILFNQLSEDLNVDSSHVLSKLSSREKFRVGMLFDGNRLRSKPEVELKLKGKDKKEGGSVLNSILLPIHRFFWYQF
jgi:hypothetical protein